MRNDERLRTIYEVMAPYIVRNEHNWRDYLAFASQFHKHSFDNILLVYAQDEDVSILATRKQWAAILYGTLWGRCADCGGIPRPVCETGQRADLPAAGGEVYCRRKAPVTVRHDWEDWNMAKFEYMQRAFSSELKPRARLVLQVLVLHCNKEGECFPSIKTIAAKCGYGVSTVKRALDELVKAGYIVKQARFDERKNGGQTSNLYTLCSDLPCPDEPENVPVPEDDASDESPAVQPESAPADTCDAPDPTPGEQSATLPTADSYSFADGFETKIGRQNCRPIRMWTGGQSIFIPP